MTPKFSIIVPIYNIPKDYVKQCIDSITAQSYSNWECIVVDDCSSIEYTELFNDSRITYIKLAKNGGVFSAYQQGFQHSTGDYIIHCDSDDWLNTTYLEQVMSNFDPKCDVYTMNTISVFDDGYQEKAIWPNKGLSNSKGLEWFDSLCERRQTSWAFWGKTLKRSILQSVYDSLNVTERIVPSYDCLLIVASALFAREVKHIPFNGFFYRINPNGVSFSVVTKEKLLRTLDSEQVVIQQLLNILKNNNIELAKLNKVREELGNNFNNAFYQYPDHEEIFNEFNPRVMDIYRTELHPPKRQLFPQGSILHRFARFLALKIYRIINP